MEDLTTHGNQCHTTPFQNIYWKPTRIMQTLSVHKLEGARRSQTFVNAVRKKFALARNGNRIF